MTTSGSPPTRPLSRPDPQPVQVDNTAGVTNSPRPSRRFVECANAFTSSGVFIDRRMAVLARTAIAHISFSGSRARPVVTGLSCAKLRWRRRCGPSASSSVLYLSPHVGIRRADGVEQGGQGCQGIQHHDEPGPADPPHVHLLQGPSKDSPRWLSNPRESGLAPRRWWLGPYRRGGA